ncbi:MAG: GDP-mannose 4,6-dehydratase [Niabella sp.]
MTSIIFGAAGQDGYYLSTLLKSLNHHVIEVSRTTGYNSTDITSYESVSLLIKTHQPNLLFHFAANSTTRHDALFENHATIGTGTLNILEAVKKFSPETKVFISGSGLQFVNNNVPIKESDAFEARDAYAVSRIQSVYASRYFRDQLGVQTYVGYLFNHDSPRRSERHMTKKISEAAKRISNGSDEKLIIGDITAVKEWSYAKDIVEGIWTLVNQTNVFEANISSGKGHSIEDWLTICFEHFNLNWKEHVVINPDFVPDYKMLVSNPSLINSLGWQTTTNIEALAQLMLA